MERAVFIEDEVLALVQYTHDDDLDWHNCWLDIDTQKGYNVKSDYKPFDPAAVQEIERFPFWATIYSKAGGNFVGVVRLSPPPYDDCDLAIWIYKPYRGMGFGTRAFGLGVRYCFKVMGLQRIGAGCFEGNIASERMLMKVGFVRDAAGDIAEVDAFTGEMIVQRAFVLTKELFIRIS